MDDQGGNDTEYDWDEKIPGVTILKDGQGLDAAQDNRLLSAVGEEKEFELRQGVLSSVLDFYRCSAEAVLNDTFDPIHTGLLDSYGPASSPTYPAAPSMSPGKLFDASPPSRSFSAASKGYVQGAAPSSQLGAEGSRVASSSSSSNRYISVNQVCGMPADRQVHNSSDRVSTFIPSLGNNVGNPNRSSRQEGAQYLLPNPNAAVPSQGAGASGTGMKYDYGHVDNDSMHHDNKTWEMTSVRSNSNASIASDSSSQYHEGVGNSATDQQLDSAYKRQCEFGQFLETDAKRVGISNFGEVGNPRPPLPDTAMKEQQQVQDGQVSCRGRRHDRSGRYFLGHCANLL